MLMKDCVELAAFLLQMEDVEKFAASFGGENLGTDEVKKEAEILTKCGNLVINEIASDWVYLKKIESVIPIDKKIMFENLSEKIIDIFKVKIKGENTTFRRYFDRIELSSNAKCEVIYSYSPAFCSLSDEILFGERISSRLIAYGIACEYCLITGRADEALTWDSRFRDALKSSQIVKRSMRLPSKQWI